MMVGKGFWHLPNVQDAVLDEFPELSEQEALRMGEQFQRTANEYGVDVGTLIREAAEADG